MPYRSFVFGMTKHLSKLGRLSDPWRKKQLQADYEYGCHHKVIGIKSYFLHMFSMFSFHVRHLPSCKHKAR